MVATRTTVGVRPIRGVQGSKTKRGGFVGYVREYTEEGEYLRQESCKEIRQTEAEAKHDAEVLAKTQQNGVSLSTKLGDVTLPALPAKMPSSVLAPVQTAVQTAAPKATGKCKLCGKTLTRDNSVAASMGGICQQNVAMLASGQSMQQHYAAITVDAVPEGWILLRVAILKAKEQGVSGNRFMQVCGGDRLLRKPLLPVFAVIFYKHSRYISEECLKHLEEVRLKVE